MKDLEQKLEDMTDYGWLDRTQKGYQESKKELFHESFVNFEDHLMVYLTGKSLDRDHEYWLMWIGA